MSQADLNSPQDRKARNLRAPSWSPPNPWRPERTPVHPLWRRLCDMGTELWLDSCDPSAIEAVWAPEFTGLAINSHELARHVRGGGADRLIARAGEVVGQLSLLSARQREAEIGFMVCAHQGLKLSRRFGTRVSVPTPGDLDADADATTDYALRLHEVSDGRFIVELPATAAGVVSARTLGRASAITNVWPGCSARQNYLIARLARPGYVTMDLGLVRGFWDALVAKAGRRVAERAALASQAGIARLRRQAGLNTRLVVGQLERGRDIADFAGADVLCFSPRVAREFLAMGLTPDDLGDQVQSRCDEALATTPAAPDRPEVFWTVSEKTARLAEALAGPRLDATSPEKLWRGCREGGAEGVFSDGLDDIGLGLDGQLSRAGLDQARTALRALDERIAAIAHDQNGQG